MVDSAIRDIVVDRYPLALSGLGGPNCDPATGTAGAGDCQYFNPFLSSALPVSEGGIANSPEMLEWLIKLRTETYEIDITSFDALLTGQFGELPGGPIGVAFGVGTRSEELMKTTDPISAAGGYASVPDGASWGGEVNINSAYFEFALPVHEEVDVQLAARYEDYDSGFSEMSPKLAAIWRPTDNLALRASIGTSFKGPAIQHLAGNTLQQGGAMGSIVIDGDVYGVGGMAGMSTVAFQTTGNPDLGPQTSENLSLGFDWNMTDNISVGASWVRIEFDDQLFLRARRRPWVSLSCIRNVNGIPADENDVPLVPNLNPAQPLIFKTVAEGGCVTLVKDPALPLTVTNIATITATALNRDFTNTDQLDLRANLGWDTPIGRLTFQPLATIVLNYELPRGDLAGFNNTCGPVACDLIGRGMAAPGLGGLPRWRFTGNTQLAFGNHNLRLTFRYTDPENNDVDDLTVDQASNFIRDDGLFTTDLNWSYRFSQGTRVSATIQNLSATIPDNDSGQFKPAAQGILVPGVARVQQLTNLR